MSFETAGAIQKERDRADRAEAECERLRADNEFLRKRRGQLVIERDQARGDLPEVAPSPDSEPAFLDGDFTLSLRELQHGLNCLSVDNTMDRPDFQLAWDIYEAATQCATPPPEGEQWEYYYRRNDCPARYATDPDCICWYPEGAGPRPNERHDDEAPVVEWRKASSHRSLDDAPHTPEQAESYPLDSEGRCLKCGGTGRIGVDSTREPCPACTSTAPEQSSYCPRCTQEMNHYSVTHCPSCDVSIGGPPPSEQTHGDALADLDYLSGVLNNPQITTLSQNGWVELRARLESVRRHLTASGVPYVPEEVRRLPSQWRNEAEDIDKQAEDALMAGVSNRYLGRAVGMRIAANELEQALASAPADGRED